MNFKHRYAKELPNIDCWHCNRGVWSFLILKDRVPNSLYFCSYKTNVSRAVVFKDNEEVVNDTMTFIDDKSSTLEDAIRSCEAKYKELLLK